MKAYMLEQFPFLGIASPRRQALSKRLFKELGTLPIEEALLLWDACWQLPEREYQYFVQDCGKKWQKELSPEHLPRLESLILQKSWWDTVDFLAPHFVGQIFLRYPESKTPYLDRWVKQENIWLQRTVLLYGLKHKQQLDWGRLQADIKKLANSSEFFVQKATGWVLREYSKVEPQLVFSFIDDHRATLSKLAMREGEKYRDR